MPFQENSGYCASCNKQVLVRREITNHVLYAILTIFSCGLWGIVWVISSIADSGKPWLCTFCGRPASLGGYDHYQQLQESENSPYLFGDVKRSKKPLSMGDDYRRTWKWAAGQKFDMSLDDIEAYLNVGPERGGRVSQLDWLKKVEGNRRAR